MVEAMIRFAGLFGVFAVLALLGALGAGGLYLYLNRNLPSAETLRDVRLQVPLRVFARDGGLIAEFGEQRRTPLRLDQIPERMLQAFIAGEDDRFHEHPGVDWEGLARAVWHLLRTGEKGPGGSTITMQVARNYFLGREKTYVRKLNEILLALKIEREFTKDEILELYVNKIFLGQRAYGVGAAARVYYGRSIRELSLPQIAMIAGLPKAPSRFNPVANPERGTVRRNYVLRRMFELGYVGEAEYAEARTAPVTARIHGLTVEVEAPYVAEMARAYMEERYGAEVYTAGYKVYTTLDSRLQHAANAALRHALIGYDVRHGYRGPERRAAAGGDARPEEALAGLPAVGGLLPALVTSVGEKAVTARTRDAGPIEIAFESMEWARPYIDEDRRGGKPASAADVVQAGDVIRVRLTEDGWSFSQLPEVEGALVSLDPEDGAIVALAGGFDFYRSKFNRATQARRQPGSSFKPFIYSAALEHGYTPASIINDAPVVFEDPSLTSAWRPENYGGKFFGPTRLRVALYKSRNLVSIRLLRDIGIEFAIEHVARFGIDVQRLPQGLSLALGSGELTPLELAAGYSVLANGGYAVEPYSIERVLDRDDAELFVAEPLTVCRECEAAAASAQAPTTGKGVEIPGEAGAAGNADVAAPGNSGGAGAGAGVQPSGGGGTVVAAMEPPGGSGGTGTAVMEPLGDPGGTAGAGMTSPTGSGGTDGAAEAGAGETPRAPRHAPRVIDARNAWLMYSLMRDVIRVGTGRRARVLERGDLAGKTGTTNDLRDAWFSGFNADLVATAWVGFDRVRPLGRRETGARAALPMWIEYMREALEGTPERNIEPPEGVVTVRIDPATGHVAGASHEGTVFESFRKERVPARLVERAPRGDTGAGTVAERLF